MKRKNGKEKGFELKCHMLRLNDDNGRQEGDKKRG
jgi:hypothetical protein